MDNKKELFIVEGESAASTLQPMMKGDSQSVLALQGKLLNVDRVSAARVIENKVCQKIIRSLDCGIGQQCDPWRLVYDRILILMDPDIDGVHSRYLLLKLFNKFLRPLLKSELVFVIFPPLFRLTSLNWVDCQYAWNRSECDAIISKYSQHNVHVMQYKGVAQFSLEERAILVDPRTRKQFRVGLDHD